MSQNKKLKAKKISKVIDHLKNNDPLVETSDQDIPDPFSFAAKTVANASNKVFKASEDIQKSVLNSKNVEKLKSSVNKDTAKDNKKTSAHAHNGNTNESFNSSEATNASSLLVERIITSVSSTMNKTLEQNTSLTQDLIKCRDAKDMLGFQQKMLETNFNNLISFYLDVNFAVQAFISKNMQISSDNTEKHVKCFTGEII
ncbi:MAG: hypothetical protein ACRYE9_02625 [Janthinobacterium lividum]